ncbi:hypothetical protein ACLBKW_01570 [Bacillus altitudinis]|uniref:hypothetical protein n=1 Tax=Bacillus TaxID=1386 RepID=UPI000B2D19ED|nr:MULTISPECIES: hypothetical protein [Bacillus]MBR3381074.1 hypothetical protein [Bacillus sp. (in: firmicutes)]WGU99745.1 hypothetical protein QJS56_14500 [Bacillus altitudinis]WOQ73303.1 hypothetical protein R0126_02885 [Bacillus stratosphericus]SPR94539.1 conserved hypothetical protein [Bacillus altitudinis]
MNVNDLKKQCIKWGIIFTVAGGIIMTIGFGLSGFDLDAYQNIDQYNVFRTINWSKP